MFGLGSAGHKNIASASPRGMQRKSVAWCGVGWDGPQEQIWELAQSECVLLFPEAQGHKSKQGRRVQVVLPSVLCTEHDHMPHDHGNVLLRHRRAPPSPQSTSTPAHDSLACRLARCCLGAYRPTPPLPAQPSLRAGLMLSVIE